MAIRPTAYIHEILLRQLVLEQAEDAAKRVPDAWRMGLFVPVMDRLQREIGAIRREMHSNAVFIVEAEWGPVDVRVTYKAGGRVTADAPFMRKMLEAEAVGFVERILDTRGGD